MPAQMSKLKVLIVDDSLFFRTILSNLLIKYPNIQVVGLAGDPFEAREKIAALNPDVVTLDINMPKMSPEAAAFTKAWRETYPEKDPNVNAALGYNCYLMFIDAIRRANSADHEAITTALAGIKDLPTPLGVLNLNETHDAEMPVGITEIRDGKQVYLGEVVPE